jgi:hypothetical protein
LHFDLDLRPVSNQRHGVIHPNIDRGVELHRKVVKVASGDGSEVFLLGKYRSQGRNKLEIVRVKLAGYVHVDGD